MFVGVHLRLERPQLLAEIVGRGQVVAQVREALLLLGLLHLIDVAGIQGGHVGDVAAEAGVLEGLLRLLGGLVAFLASVGLEDDGVVAGGAGDDLLVLWVVGALLAVGFRDHAIAAACIPRREFGFRFLAILLALFVLGLAVLARHLVLVLLLLLLVRGLGVAMVVLIPFAHVVLHRFVGVGGNRVEETGEEAAEPVSLFPARAGCLLRLAGGHEVVRAAQLRRDRVKTGAGMTGVQEDSDLLVVPRADLLLDHLAEFLAAHGRRAIKPPSRGVALDMRRPDGHISRKDGPRPDQKKDQGSDAAKCRDTHLPRASHRLSPFRLHPPPLTNTLQLRCRRRPAPGNAQQQSRKAIAR